MDKYWICLALLAVAAGAATAQNDEAVFPDYWNDYDDTWYNDELENLGIIGGEKEEVADVKPEDIRKASVESPEKDNFDVNNSELGQQEKNDADNDRKVEEEIQQFRNENEGQLAPDALFDDYQFEDNRSAPKEEKLFDYDDAFDNGNDERNVEHEPELVENRDETLAIDMNQDNEQVIEPENGKVDLQEEEKLADEFDKEVEQRIRDFKSEDNENNEQDKNTKNLSNLEKYEDLKSDFADAQNYNEEDLNMNVLLPPPNNDENVAVFDKMREILNEIGNDNDLVENESLNNKDLQPYLDDVQNIFDETNRILDEIDSNFNESDEDEINEPNENIDGMVEEKINEDNIVPEPQASVQQEDSIDKEFKDWDTELEKLSELFNSLRDDNNDDGEGRQDDDTMNEENVLDYEDKFGKPFREGVILQQREDYENLDDKKLSELFADNSKSEEDTLDKDLSQLENLENADTDILEETNRIFEIQDGSLPGDDISNENRNQENPIPYINDALVANDNDNKNEKQEAAESVEAVPDDGLPVKTININDLTSAELDQVMNEFANLHSEDLDTQADGFDRNVAAIHMALSVDEPLIITSTNYPSPYPTNNIVDWIFDGDGVGIELNITDFAINSAMGDYLLVKPGGLDDTGHEGLIFSYRLNSERRYRFLDVNKMFVRFESKIGMAFMRGFNFSVKLISPKPEEAELLEPEAILTPPSEIMTVYLGGMNPTEFLDIKEDFRQLIADMANIYINSNNIEPGVNTTSEVTQITNTSVCNINWPDYKSCVAVVFGVPLNYEDESATARLDASDLRSMWYTYIYQDPFALRLRRLGVMEFSTPDDSSVLMVWLVIAAGVVISVAMLAFALWRYSCFEDYSRMPTYGSDTDSIQSEKRNLDLYPTPHQTLPPLFAESEYKWDDGKFEDSTRVDMGGYANKSYVRDALYDIDSDDDIIPTRDRTGASVTAKELYDV